MVFILWLTCLFHLIFAEDEQPHSDPDPDVSVQELKPEEIIQKSLRDVNDMLIQLYTNITYERKVLSELEAKGYLSPEGINVSALESDMPKISQNPVILNIVAQWARNKRGKHPSLRTANTRPSPPIVAMRRGPESRNLIIIPVNDTVPRDTIGGRSHETVPQGVLELEPEWVSNDRNSSSETTTSAKLTTFIPKHNKNADMKNMMKNFNVGYHYAAMVGVNEICADKNTSDLKTLLAPLGKLIVEMADQGRLDFFGEKLVKRIKVIWLWITVLDVNVVKAFAKEAQTYFKLHNKFADDIHEIFLESDRIYDVEEGEKLLNIVEEMDKYNVKEHGPDTGKALVHKFLNALINRIKGSMRLENLITMANEMYTNRYADLRLSETFNALDSFFDGGTEDTQDARRHMSKRTNHIRRKYKKIIKQLIKKDPTLSKYLSIHKGKHHHSKKRHHTPHHKKHHSNKKQRHDHYKVKKPLNLAKERSQIAIQEKIETFPVSALQISEDPKLERPVSSIYTSTSTTTFRPVSVTSTNITQNPKRFSIVFKRNSLSEKRISRSNIRRTMNFNKNNKGKTGKSLKQFLTNSRLKASAAKIVKNNVVLNSKG